MTVHGRRRSVNGGARVCRRTILATRFESTLPLHMLDIQHGLVYHIRVDWENDMEQVLPLQKIMQGVVAHEVKVVAYGKGYSIRVLLNGEVNQESRVDSREEIGPCAKDMLRWEDKMGNISDYASAARHRK